MLNLKKSISNWTISLCNISNIQGFKNWKGRNSSNWTLLFRRYPRNENTFSTLSKSTLHTNNRGEVRERSCYTYQPILVLLPNKNNRRLGSVVSLIVCYTSEYCSLFMDFSRLQLWATYEVISSSEWRPNVCPLRSELLMRLSYYIHLSYR